MTVELELAGRSRKGALKQAARIGARYVVLSDDGDTIMHDMDSGEHERTELGAVVAHVLRERHLS